MISVHQDSAAEIFPMEEEEEHVSAIDVIVANVRKDRNMSSNVGEEIEGQITSMIDSQ
jgi:hypothetical protein